MVMDGKTLMEIVHDETSEKKRELEKLYAGDTSPLMVAMEAADEIVFLGTFVGMQPNNMVMWSQIGDEALSVAQGAMDTLKEMRVLSGSRRGGRDHQRLLSDVPKFVALAVIADKNASNYHAAYFAPAPNKYGDRGHSKLVTKAMIVDLYNQARLGARTVREAIKKQGLYTPYGMPNQLGMFATLNGRTPAPFKDNPAVQALQNSLRDHYRYYAQKFGEVGVDFLINYFRVNNPAMIAIVLEALQN
jgi:hypothetical protein